MVTIQFLGPLKTNDMQANIRNFEELKQFINTIEGLDKQILNSSAIALNDELISDPTKITLKDGDKICILPPVCGG